VLDKAEYSAFESTLNSSIVSYRIVTVSYKQPRKEKYEIHAFARIQQRTFDYDAKV